MAATSVTEVRELIDPAGDLEAELSQLRDMESELANINASSCGGTQGTKACSGGVCCM